MGIREHGEGVCEFWSITGNTDDFGRTLADYLRTHPHLEVGAMTPRVGTKSEGLKEVVETVSFFVAFRWQGL